MLDALRSIIEGVGHDKIAFINMDAATMEKLRDEVADTSNEHIVELKKFMGIPVFIVGGHPNAMYLEIEGRP